jgi:DNA-directed RNA polymerase subunit RPC12/RpoP
MKYETYITVKRYRCNECGTDNDANLWEIADPCAGIEISCDYCSGCNSTTAFAFSEGIVVPLGTYAEGYSVVRGQMLAAGRHQPWERPVGGAWDAENNRPKPGHVEDDIPF